MKVLITGGAGFVDPPGQALPGIRGRGAYVRQSAPQGWRAEPTGIQAPGHTFSSWRHPISGGSRRASRQFRFAGGGLAEPSVHAGISGSPSYLIDTNLTGTVHCLNFARKRVAHDFSFHFQGLFTRAAAHDCAGKNRQPLFSQGHGREYSRLKRRGNQ